MFIREAAKKKYFSNGLIPPPSRAQSPKGLRADIFSAKYVGQTAGKIWITNPTPPKKKTISETIKGVLQPSEVLDLWSNFSS